jgi:hypothetical protein
MKKTVCSYLIWPPFTAIWIAHVTEQVLKQPPSGVPCFEPQVDCEGYRAVV